MRDGWNFHNDIAYSLENIACKNYNWKDRPYRTIFDADAIEGGSFVEAMIILLREKTNYSREIEDVNIFIDKCSKYFGKNGYEITPEKAQELFDEFKALIKR